MDTRLNPKYPKQWLFMQGRTDEVRPQRLSLKWEYAQAGGSVLPLTGQAEGEEIVCSHVKA